ncbi:MAG: hypothetical protein Q8Q56_02795 [Alphaproteobacteria bacterium]|nr:hypothetical protein [Alphaproteobacteria bacterium]
MIDPDQVRNELLRMVISVREKVNQLYIRLSAQYETEENQGTMQYDVRFIAIAGIKYMLEHVACQINLLTLPISFLNSEYYQKIEKLRPKFSIISDCTWEALIQNIKDILKKEYDIVAHYSADFRYSNPYLLDREEDYIFLISQLIEQIVLASFMRIDNLFSHLVNHLDDHKIDNFNKKWDKLVKQLDLQPEDKDLVIEFSHIRNALSHSNGLKKDKTLINSNFPNTLSLLSKVIDILEKVLSHSKIKEVPYIPDKAAEKSIAQQADANL